MSNEKCYEDMFNLMCDERIGYGQNRTVYTYRLDPSLVIKVEHADIRTPHWQNILEYQTWLAVQDHPNRKWFAPCVHLSPDGRILIQHRTTQADPTTLIRAARAMPTFLTDFKSSNFGMIRGKLVCHDYGTNAAIDIGVRSSKVRKIQWKDVATASKPKKEH